jgi:hypothetical protein
MAKIYMKKILTSLAKIKIIMRSYLIPFKIVILKNKQVISVKMAGQKEDYAQLEAV